MVEGARLSHRKTLGDKVRVEQADQDCDVPSDEGSAGRGETAGVTVRSLGWRDRAACRSDSGPHWDGELLPSMFVMCMGCPVKMECLMEALDHEERCDAGVWGGTAPEHRRMIRKGADPYVVWHETAKELKVPA